MARPVKPIDERQLEALASIHATYEEMALIIGVSPDTLKRRYADLIEKGRARGKSSLRRLQWQSAQNGNVTMQIWLGKQLLGQREKWLEEAAADKVIKLPLRGPKANGERPVNDNSEADTHGQANPEIAIMDTPEGSIKLNEDKGAGLKDTDTDADGAS